MEQEQNFDLISWWSEQTFPGKELYKIEENGDIVLLQHSNVKERIVANVSQENSGTIIDDLCKKFEDLASKVREVEVEWLATEDKLKIADRIHALKESLGTEAALGDFHKLGQLVHDWEHTIYVITEETHAEKLKLVEQAESLAESEQWKETAQAFKDIIEKWKHTGHIDRSRNDKLWNRIEAARKNFHDRKRLHHEEEEKDLLHNLDLKIDLVEQAESLAASEDWKKTTDTFMRLTEEWKTIGHTVNKKNEELWHRFIAAKTAFFDRKRAHASKIQQEHDASCAAKLVIIEKAEALRESTEWNATAQAFATLMEEWKKTGRVPKEKGDELWARFTAAQEQFFSAKRKHFDELRSNQESNYELKKAIYERAEKIKHSSHWNDTTAEMIELLEQWKKIGPIPRSYGDKMWEDFNAARKFFFARKDANRENRKQYAESQKEARAAHAKGMVLRLIEDIREEEEKLVDFRSGLENITPGKKAAELKAHLEKLITEGEEKLKRLKEKYAQAQNDMKVPEQKVEQPEEGETANG